MEKTVVTLEQVKLQTLMKELSASKTIFLFEKLHSRWSCEKKFEDWKEYEDVMKKHITKVKGLTFVKSTKKPVGFKATYKGMLVYTYLKFQGRKMFLKLQVVV